MFCLLASCRCMGNILYYTLYFGPVGCTAVTLSLPFLLPLLFWKPSLWLDCVTVVFLAPQSLCKWIQSIYDDELLARYRRRRDEKEFRRMEPASLPATRKRRLSRSSMVAQTKSSFLTKLPLEVRHMIYEDIIRNGTLHRHILELRNAMTDATERNRARNQLCGFGCTKARYEGCESITLDMANDLCGVRSQALETRFEKFGSCRGPLGLAKTCRQVYLESIDMFYGQSTLRRQLDKSLNRC